MDNAKKKKTEKKIKGKVSNLKPARTKIEARERGRNGGIKSGIVRRNKKTFKDLFISLMNDRVADPKILKKLKEMHPDVDEQDFNHRLALFSAMYKKALSGDSNAVQAFQAIRDTVGEKPVERQEIKQETKIQMIDDLG